jgi:hypothetical protein
MRGEIPKRRGGRRFGGQGGSPASQQRGGARYGRIVRKEKAPGLIDIAEVLVVHAVVERGVILPSLLLRDSNCGRCLIPCIDFTCSLKQRFQSARMMSALL